MAVYERVREFGLVRALGMRGSRIIRGILMESCFLLLVGLVIGNVVAFAVIAWLGSRGIDLSAFSSSTDMFGMSRMIYPELQTRDFFIFNGMVFLLGLIVSLYPAWKAARFTPVEAMTHFN
jgi:ABC-type lipoprotein release transport system permease subunit